MFVFIGAAVVGIAWIFGQGGSEESTKPAQVYVDAGAPLVCDLLATPKQIEDLTAEYSCRAPGAYLTTVDQSTDPWTAGYMTTNTQGDEITFGPETTKVY